MSLTPFERPSSVEQRLTAQTSTCYTTPAVLPSDCSDTQHEVVFDSNLIQSKHELMTQLYSRLKAICPSRSQVERHQMTCYCQFGEFGFMEGQFMEPSGVAVNAKDEIVVADTNNHRIQVFDNNGCFKYQFGDWGDGDLTYPTKVAVNRLTRDFIVIDIWPTHQILVYNEYGQFRRKFRANILKRPRGVTVDCKGRIVVVDEYLDVRVIIFDMVGSVLQEFSCSRSLDFPIGVCCNDKQEIFISDYHAHCIKVFDYKGAFLRQLGAEGITNCPIGVGINSLGEVVVADSYNNFSLVVFHQDGTMLNVLESEVKHAQCFDVALLNDGSVVLANNDCQLYLYHCKLIDCKIKKPTKERAQQLISNMGRRRSSVAFGDESYKENENATPLPEELGVSAKKQKLVERLGIK